MLGAGAFGSSCPYVLSVEAKRTRRDVNTWRKPVLRHGGGGQAQHQRRLLGGALRQGGVFCPSLVFRTMVFTKHDLDGPEGTPASFKVAQEDRHTLKLFVEASFGALIQSNGSNAFWFPPSSKKLQLPLRSWWFLFGFQLHLVALKFGGS